jgi:hypothetical protein
MAGIVAEAKRREAETALTVMADGQHFAAANAMTDIGDKRRLRRKMMVIFYFKMTWLRAAGFRDVETEECYFIAYLPPARGRGNLVARRRRLCMRDKRRSHILYRTLFTA